MAETEVSLTRPAKSSQNKGKKPSIPGVTVKARLVVSCVLDTDEVLAEWSLLCNVNEMLAGTITLWYYWRWQIEFFFKLMKLVGHHLEGCRSRP